MSKLTIYLLVGAVLSFIEFWIAIKQMNRDEDDKAEIELLAFSIGLTLERLIFILYIISIFSWPVFLIALIIKISKKDEPPMEQ